MTNGNIPKECQEYISEQIELKLKEETGKRIEFQEIVMEKLNMIDHKAQASLDISKDNQEQMKAMSIVTVGKIGAIEERLERMEEQQEKKDNKFEAKVDGAIEHISTINSHISTLDGKVDILVKAFTNKSLPERLMLLIPQKSRTYLVGLIFFAGTILSYKYGDRIIQFLTQIFKKG